MNRRIILKAFAMGGVALLALGGLRPNRVLAAWPEAAFRTATLDEAMRALFNGAEAEESAAITLTAPDIAENGAVVPVTVTTDLAGVESISLFVEHNPFPLVASFELSPEVIPEVSTRIKMAETSNLIAVVRADGKLHATHREVRVTLGGCGI